jgi:hypothetical protein
MKKILSTILILSALLPAVSSAALIDSIQGYWKFDESSGNASDSTANANTLTNVGTATFAAGKINNAMTVATASSQDFKIADASQTGLDIAGAFTISFWINWTSLPGANQSGLVTKIDQGDNTFSYWVVSSYNANNDIAVAWSDDGTGNVNHYAEYDTNGSAYFDVGDVGVWRHVVVVVNPVTPSVTFYKDNVSTGGHNASAGTIPSTIFNSSKDFRIGSETATGSFFRGTNASYDEVGIWSRALSGTEVSNLYNAGAGFQYPFAGAATSFAFWQFFAF